MSKTEILKELAKLSPEDLREIRDRIDELSDSDAMDDGEDWDDLTDDQKAMIEKRLADMDNNIGESIPQKEAEARLRALYRK